MASYVVMETPARAPAAARFIRDGFSIVALIVPVIWLLWHRLWIEALAAFAFAICIGVAGELSGWTGTATLITLLVSLFVALEGPSLRVWALGRRGWREAAVIDATDEDEAMTRYFSTADMPPEDFAVVTETPVSYVSAPSSSSGPALGLLSYPARR